MQKIYRVGFQHKGHVTFDPCVVHKWLNVDGLRLRDTPIRIGVIVTMGIEKGADGVEKPTDANMTPFGYHSFQDADGCQHGLLFMFRNQQGHTHTNDMEIVEKWIAHGWRVEVCDIHEIDE